MKQEKKNSRVRLILVMIVLLAALLAAIFLTDPGGEKTESIQAVMKDAVLHEDNQMAFLGMQVNPSVISDWVVTGMLLVVAALLRIFAIPHFNLVPGKLQSALEALVSFFRDMAKSYSPHRNGFLGVYIFSAGMYIAVGTLFELLGIQSVTTEGMSMSLPAPLSDINAAIAMGLMSYGVIMSGGHCQQWRTRHPAHAERIFPAHLHELPTFRRAAERSAGVGTGVLHDFSELRAAGACGRSVHDSARAHPDLRSHHADSQLLRRGQRTAEEKGEEGKEARRCCSGGELI